MGADILDEKKKIPVRTSSVDYYQQHMFREKEGLQKLHLESEKEKERERERERLHREREREKAAAQVSSKKKVEQRISTMSEAQIMEKLRNSNLVYNTVFFNETHFTFNIGSVVSKGDPNECYKKIKRVGQG